MTTSKTYLCVLCSDDGFGVLIITKPSLHRSHYRKFFVEVKEPTELAVLWFFPFFLEEDEPGEVNKVLPGTAASHCKGHSSNLGGLVAESALLKWCYAVWSSETYMQIKAALTLPSHVLLTAPWLAMVATQDSLRFPTPRDPCKASYTCN